MIITKKQNAPANCIKPDPAQSLSDIIALLNKFAATQESLDMSLTLHWKSGKAKPNELTRQQPVLRHSEDGVHQLTV